MKGALDKVLIGMVFVLSTAIALELARMVIKLGR